MTKIRLLIGVAIIFCCFKNASAREIHSSLKIENPIEKVEKFEIAVNYLRSADLVRAAKLFKQISDDDQYPQLVREISAKELSILKTKIFSHRKGFHLSPFRPKRDYKTNQIYLELFGSTLPFTINIEEQDYKKYTFFHEYSFNNIDHSILYFFDQINLGHSISMLNSGKKENLIWFEVHPLKRPLGFSTYYKKQFSKVTQTVPLWSRDQLALEHRSQKTTSYIKVAYDHDIKLNKANLVRNDQRAELTAGLDLKQE